MEEEEKVMTVRDLIDFLRELPRDAELFAYSSHGGFSSLDTKEDLAKYFKLSAGETVLYLDYARFMSDDRKRIEEGKEWLDYFR